MEDYELKFNLYQHTERLGSVNSMGVVIMTIRAADSDHAQALGDALASGMKAPDNPLGQDYYWCEVNEI